MAPPRKPWFRFYVEAVHDRKLRRLTPAQRWLWVAVLAAARQSPVPGVLLVGEGQPMDAVDLADYAAMPVKDIEKTLPAFEKAGMLTNDGAWRVTNWNERQFESDCSTERTGKHRAMQRQRNDDATFHQRSKNGDGTADRTRPEAEAEAEAELAQAIPVTHEGRRLPTAAAAELVEQGLAILAERRLVANGSVANPAGYRRAVSAGLRDEHNERISMFAAGADGPAVFTPEAFADWLEPRHRGPEPRRDYERRPIGCDQCDHGFNHLDDGAVTPCPNCHPMAVRA